MSKHEITARRRGRGKKGNSDSAQRSRLLRLAMPFLSGDAGKELADALAKEDIERFSALWNKASSSIIQKARESFTKEKPAATPVAVEASETSTKIMDFLSTVKKK